MYLLYLVFSKSVHNYWITIFGGDEELRQFDVTQPSKPLTDSR